MIVSITIKNWMSFKDKTFFTMELRDLILHGVGS